MAEHIMSGDHVRRDAAKQTSDDATFALAPDDPRRTENRGGLDAIIDAGATAAGAPGTHDIEDEGPMTGATGGNAADATHDLGATDTGETGGGTGGGPVERNTTGLAMTDAGPAAAGPIEGSASGATVPKIEMTDIGLVDVNQADMNAPGDEENEEDADTADTGTNGTTD